MGDEAAMRPRAEKETGHSANFPRGEARLQKAGVSASLDCPVSISSPSVPRRVTASFPP